MADTPAAAIAASQKPYFPEIGEDVLARCIETYQRLGCWSPHVEITRPAFEAVLDVFAHDGSLADRYDYEQICAAPPG